MPSVDRGNDNWLIKYERPDLMDERSEVGCVNIVLCASLNK